MPRVTFVTTDGERHEVSAERGLSLMQIARMHEFGIEGTCDGSLACATCHMIVEPDDLARLETPSPEEEDMLDLAIGLQPNSRLGCQIVLTDDLDGMTVRLPEPA